jgi:hypothetical protein
MTNGRFKAAISFSTTSSVSAKTLSDSDSYSKFDPYRRDCMSSASSSVEEIDEGVSGSVPHATLSKIFKDIFLIQSWESAVIEFKLAVIIIFELYDTCNINVSLGKKQEFRAL